MRKTEATISLASKFKNRVLRVFRATRKAGTRLRSGSRDRRDAFDGFQTINSAMSIIVLALLFSAAVALWGDQGSTQLASGMGGITVGQFASFTILLCILTFAGLLTYSLFTFPFHSRAGEAEKLDAVVMLYFGFLFFALVIGFFGEDIFLSTF